MNFSLALISLLLTPLAITARVGVPQELDGRHLDQEGHHYAAVDSPLINWKTYTPSCEATTGIPLPDTATATSAPACALAEKWATAVSSNDAYASGGVIATSTASSGFSNKAAAESLVGTSTATATSAQTATAFAGAAITSTSTSTGAAGAFSTATRAVTSKATATSSGTSESIAEATDNATAEATATVTIDAAARAIAHAATKTSLTAVATATATGTAYARAKATATVTQSDKIVCATVTVTATASGTGVSDTKTKTDCMDPIIEGEEVETLTVTESVTVGYDVGLRFNQ
ncbi:chitinase-like protein [Fragilariopsis cylindrus CCMP1102]|uniref:Chitinase-like protein n=1 Tax=Fragilariopsis cylindrus CCMP1102 TaxID=635003 RepID=A0A1E7ERP4_9STRA|nr:chitinase-like protein [Fragilariopsis cylindrus CCMP1102]|eukprot:OEU08621.1 chitinase-like protein [Fragilariopsis cylindrus CCMP1102]